MRRLLYESLWKELNKSKPMTFISGPRQAGKTTLAKQIAETYQDKTYFNWDINDNKPLLLQTPYFFQNMKRMGPGKPLVVFDEIHKYRPWKNYLKGVYDGFSEDFDFLVLGSGRLNIYRKGSDSLAGRYYLLTLWPLTLAELVDKRRSYDEFWEDPLHLSDEQKTPWDDLDRLSGFPEPFFSGKETEYKRWSTTYHSQMVREDIRSLIDIRRVEDMEALLYLLPSRVGSPLSLDSLAKALQVSHSAVRGWLEAFERFFLVFRLSPWSRRISRALVKEKKLYLVDAAMNTSPAARFENRVALELLRAVTNWNELGRGRFSLHYVRNKEKEEVDFLIAESNEPKLLIETKLSDDNVSKSLLKFQNALQVPAVQLVNARSETYRLFSNAGQKVLVAPAPRWLAGLP